jgi:RNA polymerase sigma factor (sigma-70 family)
MMKIRSADALSPDSDWLLRLQQNDATALASIMDKYYRDLYHYAAKFTRDEAAIKDSIQEIFISLWKKRETATAILALRPYLLRATKNRIIKAIFSNDNGYPLDLPEEYEFLQEYSIEKIIIDRQHSDERSARLKKILENLSPRQNEVIYLKFYQHLDHNQIAELMDINRQSVYNLLHETLQKIRSVWAAEKIV